MSTLSKEACEVPQGFHLVKFSSKHQEVGTVITPFHIGGNWGSETLSDSPRAQGPHNRTAYSCSLSAHYYLESEELTGGGKGGGAGPTEFTSGDETKDEEKMVSGLGGGAVTLSLSQVDA